eukprot:CAMPEP_0196814634 /NCGR_PEP_ID=MMETSP1362-20130617/44597_1 /TAXON_ID=163516 /ORGANISM="Leptocylindrus danicus, Strain CCMP1856" /LENGTH=160 /DNA_ID=CAMNT_0042191315 /DNA_START=77 /DNA_END=559 /DNA_ORIENTATION=-
MKLSILTTVLFPTIATAFAPTTTRTAFTTISGSSALSSSATENARPDLPIEYEDDDAEFGDDEDWITENVPGKIVMNEIDLAKQVSALNQLEEKWRKERVYQEYEDKALLGWTPQAEMYNGRFAMFFLVVGLLTEYWTGVTIPGQIEEMLRVGGFIDVDM